MGDLLFGVVLAISLGLGLTAVLLAHRLQRRYRLDHLTSYLYFQVFINVFGVYGIVGRVIARKLLVQRGAAFETIETIEHFFTFLGLPFLVLAWYMFLRLSREMVDKNLSRKITLAYFSVLGAAFLAYGLAIVWANVSTWSGDQYVVFSSVFTYLYAFLVTGTLVSGLAELFRQAPVIEDKKRRQAVRLFGWTCFLAYSAALVLSPYAYQQGVAAVAYVLAFFSTNLIPLLYWRTYLLKSCPAASLLKTPVGVMTRFVEDYKISKREEEVIRELCAGKTNKEIAETLFISLQTVKDHVYRIYLKTNVNNRVQLINLIQSHGSRDLGSSQGSRV
jgi:DNA-binding CsgD family transcriptional regulator